MDLAPGAHSEPKLGPGARVVGLDALRGLAALSVVFCHHLLVLPTVWECYRTGAAGTYVRALFFPPLYLFWAGHPAVILFFVLSGYVLSLPILAGSHQPYAGYALKRFCRIYIPYAVAVAGAILGAAVLSQGEIPGLSGWFKSSWNMPIEAEQVLAHAMFLPPFGPSGFNDAVWSLVHEMRVSLVFPFLMLFVRRSGWRLILLMSVCLSVAGLVPSFHWRLMLLVDYGLTVHYADFFLIGALLAKHRGWIAARLEKLSPAVRFGLFGTGVMFYTAEAINPAARQGRWMYPVEILTAAGAAVFVAMAPSVGWLCRPPLVWLGRISYSLYLWHLPVLLATIHIGYGRLPLWSLLVLSIALGMATAALMHHLVEEPSTRLAKYLGNAFRNRLPKDFRSFGEIA